MKALTKNCFLAFLCLFGSDLFPQTKVADTFTGGAVVSNAAPSQLSELKVGDLVPDLLIENVLNHPEGKVQLSDYRGKLLILDFWATWCAPCIAGFSKADKLQKEFQDRLAILPVTYQEKEKVDKLFEKLSSLKDIRMPMAVADNTLRGLFPHRTLPHYVWIDRTGEVVAITEADKLTADNIRKYLAGDSLDLKLKADRYTPLEKSAFLIAENTHIPRKPMVFQSALTGYIPGLISEYAYFPKDKRGKRVIMTNQPRINFFQKAYAEGKVAKVFHGNRIEIQSKQADKLTTDLTGTAYEEWSKANAFCLEYIVPWEDAENFWAYFQQDLKRWFPEFESSIVLRDRKVYALVKLDPDRNYQSEGGEKIFKMDAFGATLHNASLSKFIARLNYLFLQSSPLPLVDKTGIDHPVDLDLNVSLGDIEQLRKALEQQGYGLVETTEEIEILVIRDAKDHNPISYEK
ncbi:TlpA family protein disulfide reductase [Echinicola salinicaeni]|uniref:TlpA family protein disulfide reductase n=1 Tax=Echinicola salinicaeni TaxID=2762757 RepID=UPI0016462224|nr:redoxin domain-containing protein [Echinicola salinicaeni]